MEKFQALVARIFTLKYSEGEIEWDTQEDEEYLDWNEVHANVSTWKEDAALDEAFLIAFPLVLRDMPN